MSRFVVSQVGFVRRWKKELLIKGSFNEDVLLHLAVYFAAANVFFPENYTLSEACSCWHIIPFLDSPELIFELISDFSAVLFQALTISHGVFV